jgi:hypothetical protein
MKIPNFGKRFCKLGAPCIYWGNSMPRLSGLAYSQARAVVCRKLVPMLLVLAEIALIAPSSHATAISKCTEKLLGERAFETYQDHFEGQVFEVNRIRADWMFDYKTSDTGVFETFQREPTFPDSYNSVFISTNGKHATLSFQDILMESNCTWHFVPMPGLAGGDDKKGSVGAGVIFEIRGLNENEIQKLRQILGVDRTNAFAGFSCFGFSCVQCVSRALNRGTGIRTAMVGGAILPATMIKKLTRRYLRQTPEDRIQIRVYTTGKRSFTANLKIAERLGFGAATANAPILAIEAGYLAVFFAKLGTSIGLW